MTIKAETAVINRQSTRLIFGERFFFAKAWTQRSEDFFAM
jgi:hypothetical protein